MSATPIRAYLDLSTRYLRSTNLERDFRDKRALENYVLTGHAQECLERLSKGLRPGSSQRAWRITGNYGSGKSSFALFLAHWFSGEAALLSKSTNVDVHYNRFALGAKPKYLPLLITGSREPLGRALVRGLADLLDEQYQRGIKSALQLRLRAAERQDRLVESDVLQMLAEANEKIVRDGRAAGLLILVDELGKFLEFAAQFPHQQDVYLLQRLAEMASTSDRATPLYVIGILHQGFDAYAENLDPLAQREWEKVAGRFEEIVFNQPLLQVMELVAAALRVDVQRLPTVAKQEARAGWDAAKELGWITRGGTGRSLGAELASRIYPLHATVIPAMVRTFARFGQNERSLFSFLMSDEPFGLMNHCRQNVAAGASYRLHHLYDYVRCAFGFRLAAQSYRSHWTQIDSMVESFATAEPVELALVKTVGILNLIDHPDFIPTDAALESALSGTGAFPIADVRKAVSELQKRRKILFRRGSSGGYCLWPHTSVDLESAYERATQAVGLIPAVARHLGQYLEDRALVARRHYIETGNLRYFDVRYLQLDRSPASTKHATKADGAVFVLLCESMEDIGRAEKLATSSEMRLQSNVLMAIPTEPLANQAGLIAEVLRWEWVSLNVPELGADRFGREEVSRQLQAARQRLQNRVEDLIGLRSLGGARSLRWYLGGKPQRIADGRQLVQRLSDLCDQRFPDAPQVKHELLNRHSLSSAAARARQLLVAGVLQRADRPFLGMDASKKPPEMSMYMSVLERGLVHVETGGRFKLQIPPESNDPLKLRPSMLALRGHLEERIDQRVRIPDLLEGLAGNRLGVRDGLASLLLAVFAAIHVQELAFYEEGSFLRELGPDEFLRLTKAPENFEVQLCRVAGLRADVFESLLKILDLSPSASAEPLVLDVVRPLCQFVAGLPDYSRNTKRISPEAQKVREVTLGARDPVKLIFSSLPAAMGLEEIQQSSEADAGRAKRYAADLKARLDEMRLSYDMLLHRMLSALKQEFDCDGDIVHVRRVLSQRARPLAVLTVEPRIKALILRFMDDGLADIAWMESLGSMLTSQPPGRWKDSDEDVYQRELTALSERFRGLESITFAKNTSRTATATYRLAVTRNDGFEAQEVVYLDSNKVAQVERLVTELRHLLQGERAVALAALSQITWDALEGKTDHG
ncbi:MAG: hypothetical protein V4709_12615 [Pseudomonadota bacterium]